jgi:hypothetical protein
MTDSSPAVPRDHRRLALLLLLQCLPLLGLGGCGVLWSAVPVQALVRGASEPVFWGFMGLAGLGALAALCWGLGYLYLGRRERLGCAVALLGPLFVLWSFGYLFEGFSLPRNEADEAVRQRAILWTGLLSAIPVLAMVWDLWRLARRAPDAE